MYKTTLVPLALAGTLLPLGLSAQQPAKPHLILIMTDQQRFDCLGVMGNPHISTPNIDRLARDGALFRHAYASVPSSTPSRAGLLTGMSPWRHGMLGYYRVAEHYPYEMPRMLRESGYYTFAVGKLHYAPQRNLHGFHGALLDESGRVESADFVSDYRQWFAMEAPGQDPDATGIGWNDHQGATYVLDERLHPTRWTGDQAIRFIENYDLDQPLFLKVSFARPHSPYDPPQRYADMYRDKEVLPPRIGDWCGRFADRPPKKDAAFGDYGLDHALESRRYYYGAITFVDDQIGRIIEALKEKGIYDNALIVFLSDHGDMLGDHHHWRKTYGYEGSAHIPFIVKPPRGWAWPHDGMVTLDQVVEVRDVLPTFLDMAGVRQPSEMDGMSVLPLLRNASAPWRPYIDMEHSAFYEPDNYWAGLTDGRMKYLWFFRTGEEQLFDLAADPGEEKNLAGESAYSGELLKWRRAMTDHLSERGEPYVKDGKLNRFQRNIVTGPNYPGALGE